MALYPPLHVRVLQPCCPQPRSACFSFKRPSTDARLKFFYGAECWLLKKKAVCSVYIAVCIRVPAQGAVELVSRWVLPSRTVIGVPTASGWNQNARAFVFFGLVDVRASKSRDVVVWSINWLRGFLFFISFFCERAPLMFRHNPRRSGTSSIDPVWPHKDVLVPYGAAYLCLILVHPLASMHINSVSSGRLISGVHLGSRQQQKKQQQKHGPGMWATMFPHAGERRCKRISSTRMYQRYKGSIKAKAMPTIARRPLKLRLYHPKGREE
jgi:hypothetical protein